DLAHAAVWALIHTAQNEHPHRITVLDTDPTTATADTLLATLAQTPPGEPQLALRHGSTHIPRLSPHSTLPPPSTPSWTLTTTGRGDRATRPLIEPDPAELGPGQVRVAVRAAGLNFHDVVVALGLIADEGLGGEAAGVVLETAPDVTTLRPG